MELAAKAVLEQESNGNSKAWISDETVKLIEERRKYKSRTDEDGKQTYKKINGEIERKYKKEKEE